MDELAAFLTARLDEREAAAKAAASVAGPDWHHGQVFDLDGPTTWLLSKAGSVLADTLRSEDEEIAPFLAANDPARVLREVEAGRAELARYQSAVDACMKSLVPVKPEGMSGDGYVIPDQNALTVLGVLTEVLTCRARIWSDHPGYSKSWEPYVGAGSVSGSDVAPPA